MSQDTVIYHNPSCSTSRKALEIIREKGIEPEIILYLKTPLDLPALNDLVKKLNVPVKDILRQKCEPYEQLDLANKSYSDSELLDFIVQYPVLLNRPIVVTKKGARLCRPLEVINEIL